MNRWIPSLITIVLAVVGALTPQIQSFIIAHPEASAILAGVYAVIKGLLPSPVDKG